MRWRATASTSPFFARPSAIRASVSGCISTAPRATATRVVSAFIRNVSETIHRKEAEAERLRADSAGIHDRLNGLFAEAKRIDLIRNRRAEARKQALQEAETAAQAEGFLSIWLDDQR